MNYKNIWSNAWSNTWPAGRWAGVLALLTMVSFLTACEPTPPQEDPAGEEIFVDLDADEEDMRIISMAPAMTRMIVDLGGADLIVGVTEFDKTSLDGVRNVGSAMNPNSEAMLQLRPTHVFEMRDRVKIPDRIKQLADAQGFLLIDYPYPNSIEEMTRILFDIREFAPSGAEILAERQSLGSVLDERTTSQLLALSIMKRMSAIEALTMNQPTVKVLLLIGTQPVGASGPGTVLDDLLRHAGAANVLDDDQPSYLQLDRESILRLAPDAIVLVEPSGAEAGDIDRDARFAALRGLDIPAVRDGRVMVLTHRDAMLPTSTLAEVGAELAIKLHPHLANHITELMNADPKTLDLLHYAEMGRSSSAMVDDEESAVRDAVEKALSDAEFDAADGDLEAAVVETDVAETMDADISSSNMPDSDANVDAGADVDADVEVDVEVELDSDDDASAADVSSISDSADGGADEAMSLTPAADAAP